MDNKQVKYQTGENSLKDIGLRLNKITPSMVNRLYNSAYSKVKSLCQDKPIKILSLEEDEDLEKLIKTHRLNAVNEYLKLLKSVNYDTYNFIFLLNKMHYITDCEFSIIKDDEIEHIAYLKLILLEQKTASFDAELEVKKILLEDIEKEENIHKLYQSIVARLAFPDKKRGRPKKTQE